MRNAISDNLIQCGDALNCNMLRGVERAFQSMGASHLQCPMEDGLIIDWDKMEHVWSNLFENKLKKLPSSYPILITEMSLNPKASREKMTEILFEKFQVPSLYISPQPVLSLYATGHTTGISVDFGHGITQIVPVYQGNTLHQGIQHLKLGGRDVTAKVLQCLHDQNSEQEDGMNSFFDLGSTKDWNAADTLKRKACYVALDFDEECTKDKAEVLQTYHLPDGRKVALDNERYGCPEIYFQPQISGNGTNGVHQLVHTSSYRCDCNLRKALFGTIVVAGGSSLLLNLPKRFQSMLATLLPSQIEVGFCSAPDRQFSPWVGGSIFSSQSLFHDASMNASTYSEAGPMLVHKACI